MKFLNCFFTAVIALLLPGCGTLQGPIAGRSASVGTPVGEVTFTEARHRPSPMDYYFACRQNQASTPCISELREAMRFSCADTMEPRVYALCARCFSVVTPNDSECAHLAKLMMTAGSEQSSAIIVRSGSLFKGDGTADPLNHPPVGPIPHLTE